MRLLAAPAVIAALVLAGPASASIWIANNARNPSLRVDARGYAEVAWTAQGRRQTLLVPPRGKVLPGGYLPARNVAHRVNAKSVPLAVLAARTPNGAHWALQAWRPKAGGPLELHLARWRGAPTELELTVRDDGLHLDGRATFHGRPVTGYSPTPAGKRVREYAYLDCLGCPTHPKSWTRMAGVPPKADGTFSVFLRPDWLGTFYRATMPGPNRGWSYAPDATATVKAKRPLPE